MTPEQRHRRVQAILTIQNKPEQRIGVYVQEGDPVLVAVAVRGKGTLEIEIPKAKWNMSAFLKLIDDQCGVGGDVIGKLLNHEPMLAPFGATVKGPFG